MTRSTFSLLPLSLKKVSMFQLVTWLLASMKCSMLRASFKPKEELVKRAPSLSSFALKKRKSRS